MISSILEARKLFGGGSSSSSNHTCPVQSLDENATQPFTGTTSFYHFDVILSGACAAFVTIVMIIFMFLQATHLSKPNEQIKILRISVLIPAYAIVSFLNVCFPATWVYLYPWLDVVQSISLCSFFLLLCEFVSPSTQHRDVFFAALTVEDKKKHTTTDGLTWFRRKWLLIFQYPIVSLLVAVLTDITQAAGVYCQFESAPYFAKLWLNLLVKASLAFAVLSVFRFYSQLKAELTPYKPLQKFLAFKLVVFLTFLENIVFWILRDVNNGSALNPTPMLTYADLNIGIPSLIIILMMVPLCVFFHYAYTYKTYKIGSGRHIGPVAGGVDGYEPQSYTGGPLGISAFIEMLNPKEIIEAIVFGFRMNSEHRRAAGSQGQYQDMEANPMVYNSNYGEPQGEYQQGGYQGRYE